MKTVGHSKNLLLLIKIEYNNKTNFLFQSLRSDFAFSYDGQGNRLVRRSLGEGWIASMPRNDDLDYALLVFFNYELKVE